MVHAIYSPIYDAWKIRTAPPPREHCCVGRRKMVGGQIFIGLSRGGWNYQPPLEMVFQGQLVPPATPENRVHF